MPSKTADKFREAVRCGNFSVADRLLVELRREVESSWTAAAAEERQRMARQVLDLLNWARQAVLVSRSQVQHRLAQVRREGAYVPAARERLPIEFEG
jgi:hypothetical protein